MNEEIALVNMEEGDENDSEEIIDIDKYNFIDDEDEENIISSLFPSSNQRDINSLCKKFLTGIIDQTRCKLQAFNAGDLMNIMNTFAKPIYQSTICRMILDWRQSKERVSRKFGYEMN